MVTWAEICADPVLQNLPYKIETNRFGKIMMSPASFWHGGFEIEIGHLLKQLMQGGRAVAECAIKTTDGIRVADVAWISRERYEPHRKAISLPIAPEICVEIISSSNTKEEMLSKMQLYFSAGAKETWLCDEDGNMEFYHSASVAPIPQSVLCPLFPVKVVLD
ncbi:Uma2 family endonuclease [Phragmitibacter flavus]|uniref:Uma2 family endonuclease n=1 Tax=Phragmitibacter flavus TaxID=2576071 RepID=A0A5R8KKB7_9BACT|nr:Uma2 family endonuclease [Phragmitibacter flavus]TLD72768.1 Uma2 family endonuclease [Phragmitibacter flavus]